LIDEVVKSRKDLPAAVISEANANKTE